MNKRQLTDFANDITKCEVKFLKQVKFGKWYEQEFTSDFESIETDSFYGVCINGGSVDFVFKTGKNEDTFFKSFITQFISKFEMKRTVLINGEIRCKTKEECIKEFKNNNRVSKYIFYTTLYGIGFFSYFMNIETEIDTMNLIGKYLKSKGIQFKPEKSEAGWVTRLIINKDVSIHNKLLTEFNTIP